MKLQRDQSGQALMEFAFALPMLCIFMLGVVDYGLAIRLRGDNESGWRRFRYRLPHS